MTDDHLGMVVKTLVDRCGLRAVLMAVSAVCLLRGVELIPDNVSLAMKWRKVGIALGLFAQRRTRGLT